MFQAPLLTRMSQRPCWSTTCAADASIDDSSRWSSWTTDAWRPAETRTRNVSAALWAYAAMTTSADKGAVRDVSQIRP